jgi:hypothetical protein
MRFASHISLDFLQFEEQVFRPQGRSYLHRGMFSVNQVLAKSF